jgi:hypothetical protein
MADDGSKTLGQRIVEAARLATIAHLSQLHQAADPVARRREAVGGADSQSFKDEAHPSPADDECDAELVRQRASSTFAAEGRAS